MSTLQGKKNRGGGPSFRKIIKKRKKHRQENTSFVDSPGRVEEQHPGKSKHLGFGKHIHGLARKGRWGVPARKKLGRFVQEVPRRM